MTRDRSSAKTVRYAITGVLSAALVLGSAGLSTLSARSVGSSRIDSGLSRGKLDSAVAKAEKAVAARPADAAARLALGHAYLAAGRFQSAAVTFDDAIKLGDQNGQTALSLALALTGAGQRSAAVNVLEQWRDAIPAADLGLAFALAGEPGRGTAILADALRSGENSAKMRQNLAYSYALDGRWREARLMASQDVPADKIDERIGEWAMLSRPEDFQRRVAALLGVPARNDPGQPQRLALSQPAGDVAQLAAQSVSVPAPAPVEPAAPAPVLAAAELPPISVPVVQPVPAVEAHVSAPAPVAAAAPEAGRFAAAFSGQAFAPVKAPAASAGQARPLAPLASRTVRPSVALRPTHLVQLGSFSSPGNARRAVRYFLTHNASLRAEQLTVTPAVVNGRNFWRVAASGFTAGTAARMCSTVKSRGGACFAYAAARVPAGVQPNGPLRARR